LITLNGQNRRSVRASHSLFSFQRSGQNRPSAFHAAGLITLRKHPLTVKRYFPNIAISRTGEICSKASRAVERRIESTGVAEGMQGKNALPRKISPEGDDHELLLPDLQPDLRGRREQNGRIGRPLPVHFHSTLRDEPPCG